MPEVSDTQKQAVKAQAARMAVNDNNMAAILAGGAAVVALLSPPHAAVLGVGSAALWFCGNYRQSVANDPSRDDFDVVTVTSAQLDESALPAEDDRQRVIARFDAMQLLVSDGLLALRSSLERYDGARAAGNDSAANDQADAVRQNAEIVAGIQESLVPVVSDVNQAWVSLRDQFQVNWAGLSLADMQQFYRDTVGDLPESPGTALSSVRSAVAGAADDILDPGDTGLTHPVLDADTVPSEPAQLIGDDYVTGLNDFSAALRTLVVDSA
ncbi:hypothetical protein [Streptomyces sp. NPDC020983]|uniref:hypothetical protein n=1 Tax=Streptomyces sp. NPDC020983 TaxID=3365106 RepID=UPI00379D1C25